VLGQAQALVSTQLQSMQSAAFGPALASLGLDPANLSLDKMKSLASGAFLQNALIAQVTQAAGGALTSFFSQIVQPQLAQSLVTQVTSALQGGRITPEALLDSMLPGIPGAGSILSKAGSLSSVPGIVAQRTISKEITSEGAAIALLPSLSPIADQAAQAAVKEFVGDDPAIV